jgi:non-heme chloroperoxidase
MTGSEKSRANSCCSRTDIFFDRAQCGPEPAFHAASIDGFQAQLAAGRSQFYRDIAAGPFYGYNRPGAKASEAVIENWWRQGMMGGAKAHYDGIVAFSQTVFTEDLKKITVPVLVMHGDDDQIVPCVYRV